MVRAAMTRDLLAAHAQGTVKVAIGRASDFFGPGVTGSAVGDRFFPAALAGKALDLVGDADALHSYTYLEDFGEALVILGERPEAAGRAWHVPTAPAVTSRQFAQRVLEAARSSSPVRVVPRWMVLALGLFVPEVRETVEMLYEFEAPFVVDDSAFRKAFGFAGTALSESIPATVRSYAAREHQAA
jgi:nucleoside-diphosphate-sugar epimerase